jgi:hypothetical protein
MSGQQPNSLRQNELPEYPFVGPFGGVQSEVSSDKVGRSGFVEVQNVIFRKSQARLLPAFTPLSSPSGELIMGVADFFNQAGTRIPVVWTSTKMYSYSSGVWTQILGAAYFTITGSVASGVFVAGEQVVQGTTNASAYVNLTPPTGAASLVVVGLVAPAADNTHTWIGQVSGAVYTPTSTPTATVAPLTGSILQFFQWDVIGYRLYFSQGKDPVQVWDGITTYYSPSNSYAVPGKYLCELDFHLLVANTVEAGNQQAANRVHWTGAGTGQDWTSYNSGQSDLFNGLGPINGLARIYQAGYAFQQWGIVQITPTGNGLAPFQFTTMGSRAKGSILPYGVASFGEVIACYVGKDNVYLFDGTESNPIGSRPIDGNRLLGARTRILADLFYALQTSVTGFILTSANGNDYESYWLLIPQLNKAWVFHFDEGNWTQVFFNPSQLVGPVGVFPLQSIPRIMDLVGTIQSQSWSPSSLGNANQLDTMVISDANADSISWLNFGVASSAPTSGSINTTDGWYIKSGQLTFDDDRHNHSCNAVRLSLIDYANVTIYFRLTNEFGQTTGPLSLTYGTGSGAVLKQVITFPKGSISGKYLTWELAGPKGVQWGMSEITPYYDISGEIQNNR